MLLYTIKKIYIYQHSRVIYARAMAGMADNGISPNVNVEARLKFDLAN